MPVIHLPSTKLCINLSSANLQVSFTFSTRSMDLARISICLVFTHGQGSVHILLVACLTGLTWACIWPLAFHTVTVQFDLFKTGLRYDNIFAVQVYFPLLTTPKYILGKPMKFSCQGCKFHSFSWTAGNISLVHLFLLHHFADSLAWSNAGYFKTT